jgi:hypothetical protein
MSVEFEYEGLVDWKKTCLSLDKHIFHPPDSNDTFFTLIQMTTETVFLVT